MASLTPSWGTRLAEVLPGVSVEYPLTSLRQRTHEIVRLTLTPLSAGQQLSVARAIKARGSLLLTSTGTLLASADHPLLRAHLERRIMALPEQSYDIEIRWELLRKHPRIFSLSPVINSSTRPKNEHLYTNRHPDVPAAQGLCVYPAHYGLFSPQGDPVQLVLWIAAYLACDAIQVSTGHWIGEQASHDSAHIVKKFAAAECWCGSGHPMTRCHGRQPITGARPAWRLT